jgi:signal transduction histidine kinase
MTDQSEHPNGKVSYQEINSMRHNLQLLSSQLQSGKFDGPFLKRQVDKLAGLMERLEADYQERRREGRFEALYNVSRLIGSSLDLQTVLDQVMDAIIQLTGAERGFLMLRDDDGGLTVKVARNLDQQTLGGDKFKYSRTVANEVLDSGQAVVTTNAAEDPRFAGQASIVGQSLRSIMATPLRARGNVIGVVYVDSRAMAGLFDENDLAALDTFAGQAAVALDNARLFSATDQQLSERLDELTQLRRIDLQLNETLDADRTLLYTLEWCCRLSQSNTGHLGLLEGDPPRLRAAHHYGPKATDTQLMTLEESFPTVPEAISTGRTVVLNSHSADELSLMAVPLYAHRERKVIGAVILRREGEFTTGQQDLVERVIARAAVAIENARLYEAVQAADRAKSEFVGIVAHDLKVPMTSILGYADLTAMENENLTERQQGFLRKIRDTVKRMEILVSDLADISRIESGHFYMNETKVKAGDILQAVKDNTLTQIKARKHELVEEISPDLPDMWVDYYRLLQVLTNLVSNAYKYTPEGGTITMSACPRNGRLEFSVADTGIGLTPEAIAMLGTKFWRAEDEFTRSQPGTGLGYAITRALVEQMGDTIVIESEVGKGSKFTFSVPVATN